MSAFVPSAIATAILAAGAAIALDPQSLVDQPIVMQVRRHGLPGPAQIEEVSRPVSEQCVSTAVDPDLRLIAPGTRAMRAWPEMQDVLWPGPCHDSNVTPRLHF